jgi:hypothetical protein
MNSDNLKKAVKLDKEIEKIKEIKSTCETVYKFIDQVEIDIKIDMENFHKIINNEKLYSIIPRVTLIDFFGILIKNCNLKLEEIENEIEKL